MRIVYMYHLSLFCPHFPRSYLCNGQYILIGCFVIEPIELCLVIRTEANEIHSGRKFQRELCEGLEIC